MVTLSFIIVGCICVTFGALGLLSMLRPLTAEEEEELLAEIKRWKL